MLDLSAGMPNSNVFQFPDPGASLRNADVQQPAVMKFEKFPSFSSEGFATPKTPMSACSPLAPTTPGNSNAEIDKRLLSLFPKEMLRANRHDFHKFKLQLANLKLSPAESDRLRKLRRKELSCVYASRQREKAKAKEREKLAKQNQLA